MGFVVHVLLAFASLALPQPLDLGERTPLAGVWLLLFVPFAYLLARGARWAALRGRPRSSRWLELALTYVAVLAQWSAVGLLGWTVLVAEVAGELDLNGWPGPAFLLALLPYLVVEVVAIDARSRLYAERGPDLASVRGFQLRLLTSVLVPFVLYLLVSWAIGRREVWRVHLEEVALYAWLFTVLLLVGLVLILPRLLTSTWSTRPLEPGPRRAMLEALARRGGLRCRDLFVWRTGGTMANAAVVGFTPRSRVVLFSDALLDSLAPDELAAVFAHEVGHVRRRHALVFACYALGLYFLTDLATAWVGVEDTTLLVLLLAALVALWVLGIGYLSRRFELEADLESLELTGDPMALARALLHVTGAHAYRRTSWRHFSSERRVHFLSSVTRDPSNGHRLRRSLRRWARLGVLFLLGATTAQVLFVASSFDRDRAVAELRLGRYDEAATRWSGVSAAQATELDERDAALARLLRVARDLPSSVRAPEELEQAALAAFSAGDDEGTLDLLQLAQLRGRAQAAAILTGLEARVEGAEGLGPGGDLPAAWLEALERRRAGGPR